MERREVMRRRARRKGPRRTCRTPALAVSD
jgi:hypothetical protein